ncbi:MAG: hypothetical protein HQL28_07035 [Candidatus Omnitrophica bacterium]|nr:hypothetical protein [Candidatus Omnitrophota bacterium]
MIELNLLPKELRVQKKKDLPKIPLIPIAVGVLASVILLHLTVGLMWNIKRYTKARMDTVWAEIQDGKKRADALEAETKLAEKQLKVTNDIATITIEWTDILSGLNKAVVPQIWLTSLKPITIKTKNWNIKMGAEKFTDLELVGYALGKAEAPTVVGKFIESLKWNDEFYKYFSEIKLEGIRHQKMNDEEVMEFKLLCKFKARGKPVLAPKGIKSAKVN